MTNEVPVDMMRYTGTITVEFEFEYPTPRSATLQEASERIEDTAFQLSAASFVYSPNDPNVRNLKIMSSYLDDVGIDPDELDLKPDPYHSELNKELAITEKENLWNLASRVEELEHSLRWANQKIANITDILVDNNLAVPLDIHRFRGQNED